MNLTKPNYRAWLVKAEDYPQNGTFKEKAEFLLQYAILAPSAHNTQPWLFKIQDNEIKIYINKKRMLTDSDLLLRQTHESIGACIENLVIAADYFGFDPQVEYILANAEEDAGKKLVANINLTKKSAATPLATNLFPVITKRHSAKLNYKAEGIPENILSELNKLNTFDNLSLNFFSGQESVAIAAEAVVKGTEAAFADPKFIEELTSWLRPNWTDKPDGMPGFTVGMPAPISWLAPKIMKRFDTGSMQAKMMSKSVLATPAFGVISGENNAEAWLLAGRLYERVALAAVKINLNTANMGAPVEVDIAAEFLKEKLGLAQRPLIFFRIGKKKGADLPAPRMAASLCVC